MYCKRLKLILLLLVIRGSVCSISAQGQAEGTLKVGDNPYTVNEKAVLDIESTAKGLLPPRMSKAQRDAIIAPPAGLLVWCSDCNGLSQPASAELCISLGSGWVPFTMLTASRLRTGKKADADKPVKVSPASVTINGTLVNVAGAAPVETGVVWREITGSDFASLPVLDAAGTAFTPAYKTAGTLVTADGSAISVTIPMLTSTTGSAKPYYFRTYAKSSSGIGYGNTVIFNCAPPSFTAASTPDPASMQPVFTGSLIVNAGTPGGTITEYGYCSSKTNNLPTTADSKVMLSDAAKITALDASLNSEVFTADPAVDLSVNDFVVSETGTAYFRYYVIAEGNTFYSNVVTFNPAADPVTGGTAEAAVVSIDAISAPLRIGEASSSTITVNFNVTRAGTYAAFVPGAASGATTGLSMPQTAAGTFSLGAQSITFAVTGTPAGSFAGNSFAVPRIGSLTTGAIIPESMSGAAATCDATHETTVVPITSSTSKIWMDRNLGASRAGTSITDFEAYGCLYQWGRGNDGHASITWTFATAGTPVNGTTGALSASDTPDDALFIINGTTPFDWRSGQNSILWQGISGVNNPCPAGYRVPTDSEFTSEVTAYSITNSASAYSSLFKFVVSGSRSGTTGGLSSTGSIGYYWYSTVSGNGASMRNFSSGNTVTGGANRSFGYGVRCIKE